MNEEGFNLEIRRFLKQFGVAGQRGIEKAVDTALADGGLKGGETLKARAVLEIDGLGTVATVEGEIALG